MNDFSGKTVLVTGGTSGIGRACAIRFAKEGANVIIAGRSKEKGKVIVEEMNSISKKDNEGNNSYIYINMADRSSISKLSKYIEAEYGTLDILVNNAGIYPVSDPLESLTDLSLMEMFEINVVGMIMLTQAVLPMIKKSHGTIINNASVAGLESFTSGQSYAYAASKASIIKFTKMIAKQYGAEFRTNCICPGIIKTPIFKTFNEEKFVEKIPMKRVGLPEDVAAVVCFLASEDAAFVNGAVITIDGGQSL